jgi:hypothetical protein
MPSSTPRRKRMSRTARLQSAKHWIPTYSGRDIVKGYRKWYGVDTVCAILELRQLGVDVPETRLLEAKRTEEATSQRRREQKHHAADVDLLCESDESFAFIAGYTSNGVPYGVLWEEMEGTDDYDEEGFSGPHHES